MACPTEDALAAFVEGHLSPAEAQSIVEHIDRCVDCRTLVAGAAAEPVQTTSSSVGTVDTMADGTAERQSGPSGPRLRGYRILQRIGQGAMGEVYRAEDEQLVRPVAVKLLALASTPAVRQRFLNEARTVARLRHPNIVTIYASDISGERPFIVSELLSGVSLDRLALPLPGGEVLRIGAALASGLAAAHRQGILHRDIKPANAMQTDEGEVKLLDFGLAKLVDAAPDPSGQALASAMPAGAALTHAGALVGTPLYMAPELWRGEPATAATDVYSFGALLYELASRREPLVAVDPDALDGALGSSVDPELGLLRSKLGHEAISAIREAISSLTAVQRNVLRLHYFDQLSFERMGVLFKVNRATVCRWVAEARRAIIAGTRRRLRERLLLRESELDVVARLLHSQLDVSLSGILHAG